MQLSKIFKEEFKPSRISMQKERWRCNGHEVSAKNDVRVEYKILEGEGRIARRRLQRS